ncbi:MAG: hypothetical protein RBT67_16995 [Thauera sp.]|nr:hypothetical protein [Thauera sp.]
MSAIKLVDTIFGADAAQLKTALSGRLRSFVFSVHKSARQLPVRVKVVAA